MDYYAVLGITKSSSPEEIKQAYRKLAMKHHPDKGGDEAEFKKINEAYAVLGNPEKKSQYDSPRQQNQDWTPPEWAGHDPFGQGSPFNEMFGDIFGRRQQVKRNPDGVTDITISVAQAYTGANITLDLGYVKDTLSIPAGVRDGTKFRMHGKGPSRFKDLPPGDLIIRLNITYPNNLGRENDDLFIRVNVDAMDAMQGTEIDYTHISDRQIKIKIPPGVQPGAKLRIQGWGMPNPQTKRYGDLYVLVSISITKLTDPQHIQWLNIIKEETGKSSNE